MQIDLEDAYRRRKMIKLQVDEYENLVNEIGHLHGESIAFIKEYMTDINGLLVQSGGFHADLISEKIEMLLNMFQGQ